MRLALCLLALAVLLAPSTVASTDDARCTPVYVTINPPEVTVEPECIPPATSVAAGYDAPACAPIEIVGNPPSVHFHPDCLPVAPPWPVSEVLYLVADLLDVSQDTVQYVKDLITS